MSSLCYQVRAKRNENGNVQKLECVGVFVLFCRGYSNKRPLPGNDFTSLTCYQHGTEFGANTGGKVGVETRLDVLGVDWIGLDWYGLLGPVEHLWNPNGT